MQAQEPLNRTAHNNAMQPTMVLSVLPCLVVGVYVAVTERCALSPLRLIATVMRHKNGELEMNEWSFEHSIYTNARRDDAWAFWSDMRNLANMEPGIERIELDGPFETGTTGRTITKEFAQEWELTDVVEQRRWIITGYTADGAGSLSFAWEFADEGPGTRMTQTIRATGPGVQDQMEELRHMELNAPKGMVRLAEVLDGLAAEKRRRE